MGLGIGDWWLGASGAGGERSEEFRKACHDLAEALEAATTRPSSSLRSLYLSELLHAHRDSATVSWESVIHDLTQCFLSNESKQRLEALARLLEIERAKAASRIQSMR